MRCQEERQEKIYEIKDDHYRVNLYTSGEKKFNFQEFKNDVVDILINECPHGTQYGYMMMRLRARGYCKRHYEGCNYILGFLVYAEEAYHDESGNFCSVKCMGVNNVYKESE